jgi:hypothetical protein
MLVMAGIIPASQASITTIGKPYSQSSQENYREGSFKRANFQKHVEIELSKNVCV